MEKHDIFTHALSEFERILKIEIGKFQTDFNKFAEENRLDIASVVSVVHRQVNSEFQAVFDSWCEKFMKR